MIENQPKPAFRLLRVITIDSYSPGGEIILRVDGGAILTGENGAGKTSLIRLIPVFFGELPRRISVGTLSFADFYLARTTSYIIFEYERQGVVCQSVLYAGHGDEAYVYRFIRAPYALSLFTEQDGKTIIPGGGLPTHLKKLGVDHSRGLAHDAYRAIIQGRSHSGRDASASRQYVADYAFTTQGNRLDHIDRIVSGMFRRQAEFKDFLRMVVSYISDRDRDEAISIAGDRGKIAIWPKQYSAYQAVMRLAPRMTDVGGLEAELSACTAQFGVLHAKTLMLLEHSKKQAEQCARLHDEAQQRLTEDSERHDVEIDAIAHREASARFDAERNEARVAEIDRKKSGYDQDGMDKKARVVDDLPTLLTKHREALSRREFVVGAKDQIDRKYSELKVSESKGLNERLQDYLQKQEAIRQKFDIPLGEIASRRDAALEALADEHRGQIEATNELIGRLREEAGGHEQAARNPTADPLINEAWQRKRDAAEAARKARKAPLDRRDRSLEASKLAQADFARQDEVVQMLARRIDDMGSTIIRLKAQADPAPDSLLSFLRKERPDFPLDIARVIDESLLVRTDLAPTHVEGAAAAMYGVSLDLSRIDSPLVADEGRLRHEIKSVEAQQARLQEDLADQQALLNKAGVVLDEANREVQMAQAALAAAEVAVASAESEERTSRTVVNQSVRENEAKAKEAAALARGKERVAQQKLAGIRESQKQAEVALKSAFAKERTETEQLRKNALGDVELRIAQDKDQTEQHLAALDAERNQALSAEGVDVATLEKIDAEIKNLDDGLRNARLWEKPVMEWRAWLAGEWTERADLAKRAAQCREKAAKELKLHQDKLKAWESHRKEEGRHITKLEAAAKVATDTAHAAEMLIDRNDLHEYTPAQDILSGHYDASWTLDGLTAQISKNTSDARLAGSKLKVRIDEIKKAFRGGAGTPTEDYFQSTADAVDPNDNDYLAWVAPLREWYERRHEEYLRPLLVEARKFGELVIGFQRDVEKFTKRISSFNSNMQKKLDETELFVRISNVSINFTSTIANKKYWAPINQFAETHESWIRGISHDLPPPSFAADLDNLLEHWDIREGIKAERLSLIDVAGSVVENGVEKKFRDSSTLSDLSSTGLSYLILIVLFVAFLRMIRGDADVRVTYAVDELGDLDRKNIGILVDMLRRNSIDIVSACPETDLVVLQQFPNRYKVTRDGASPDLIEIDMSEIWEATDV